MLISVMIPTYNQDKYIKKAIESVLSQTYKNIEIIISDDSTNNLTENIIKNFYSNNKKIRYFHNIPSKGKTDNYRYMLYELVRGQYVLNLDGDDYLEDNKFIENAIDLIYKYELIMVVAKQKIYKVKEDKLIYPKKEDYDFLIKNGTEIFLDSIFKNFEIPHLATIFNVEVAKKIGFYEYDIPSSDRESLLKLSLHGKVGVLNKIAGVWMHHGSNISQNMELDELLENIKMYDRLYKYALKSSNMNKYILNLWKILAKYKNLYGYVYSLKDKSIINEICKKDYKFYGFLLKLDPRLKKVLN